ncbi:type B DNA-directed DNA polymerase [Haloarcula salinisoli]|uniref:DNA-directed DNA polymerase n=1 Tax=Haloarcula salinisoli TaxID=2487746 RepID=A0A8J7YBS7_9EURY|nr:type B DNA-directed DNA polymerase [Halomicroarcula salinisoli]MBX0302527.1 type B DNA-directed DNA polymerase [Halomicroarcula salinisoli]
MVFAVDVTDDAVRVWSRDGHDAVVTRDESYTPSLFVAADRRPREWLRDRLADDPKVVRTATVERRRSLRADGPAAVLRVDVDRPSEVATLAREIRTVHEPGRWAPGRLRLFNVDMTPKFRYCLERDTQPVPTEELRTLALALPERAVADDDLTELRCAGDRLADDETGVLEAVAARLREHDPDVLVLSTAALVPLLAERATACGVDLQLGRRPGYRQLAGDSTYESYGRVGHSPARYDVPGRAIVDRSNSFLWDEGGLPGLLDLVERSWKPLQEAAWASIGSVFTAIQIREAFDRGVLVPWRAWEGEAFKPARTLHDADRGGFTFEPRVGLHENVVEIDFASLYPSIMCVHNLSPETVRCGCHDTDDVPTLDYSVCPEPGFVPSVLRPIIDDRADLKERMRATDDADERARLDARASALKWILVTCFGYQGFSNAKFGRIEVHEAINAVAREVMLDAKATLETGGWRVLHGIVDSLWVTPARDDHEPLSTLTDEISNAQGIPLEHEDDFAWVCLVPTADGRRGALTKYFGKVAGRDEYKFRGIECRQRSTPTFVADAQRDLIETLDDHREPEPVADRLSVQLSTLHRGAVDPEELVVRKRVSKPLSEYQGRTQTVAALERYADHGIDRAPGQSIRYVVVDDDKRSRARVRLPFEADGYDDSFYTDLLLRAAESVLSPLGWDRDRIERYLRDTRDARLSSFE